MADLTVCTVSFRSARHLELNIDVAAQMNAAEQLGWLIIENTPPNERGRCMSVSESGVEVMEGVKPEPGGERPASHHHALALNKGISLVRTRYALIMDPDFYIVFPGWATRLVQHMDEYDLAFWGVPWHPKWYGKYRYFPCVHCLLIDLSKVPRESLDFSPDLDVVGGGLGSVMGRAFSRLLPTQFKRLVLGRRRVGKSRDTGFRVYQQFYRHPSLKAECAQPVFRPGEDLDMYAANWLRWLLPFERALPDRLSYIPKAESYFVEEGFCEMGYADARSRNWEEFLWQGRPFGFHVRGFMQGERDPAEEVATIRRIVASVSSHRS